MTETQLAMLLLKYSSLFAGGDVSAETIWRSQKSRVKQKWVEQATAFRKDLHGRGYGIAARE